MGNLSYGEATGITQTIRNFGASLGLAGLGTILLFSYRSHLTTSLKAMGDPHAAAEANRITQSQQGSGSVNSIPHFVSLNFAQATEVVLYVMCGIMGFAASSRSSGCSGAARRWRPSRTALFLHPPRRGDSDQGIGEPAPGCRGRHRDCRNLAPATPA